MHAWSSELPLMVCVHWLYLCMDLMMDRFCVTKVIFWKEVGLVSALVDPEQDKVRGKNK